MLEKSVDFLLIVPEIKKLLALSDVVGGDSTQDRCTCRHLGKEGFFLLLRNGIKKLRRRLRTQQKQHEVSRR